VRFPECDGKAKVKLHSHGRQETPVAETKVRRTIMQPIDTETALPSDPVDALFGDRSEDLAPIAKSIEDALSDADGWSAFVGSLEAKGLTLVPKGGGLVVRDRRSGVDICKLSSLGFRYVDLIRKFGEGFPGHPATWLVQRALTESYIAKTPTRSRRGPRKRRSSRGGDDLTPIED
jgi:ATP-dependent DNA helicase RecQ